MAIPGRQTQMYNFVVFFFTQLHISAGSGTHFVRQPMCEATPFPAPNSSTKLYTRTISNPGTLSRFLALDRKCAFGAKIAKTG